LDGLNIRCRVCALQKTQEFRRKQKKRSPEEVKTQQAKKLKTANGDGQLMNTCNACKKEKPIDQFSTNMSNTVGLMDNCKHCEITRSSTNYFRAKKIQMELKEGQHCEECGVSDPELLTFAHWDREDKYKTKSGKSVGISEMIGIKRIREEATKTRFLCHFCHRLETQRENEQFFELKWNRKAQTRNSNFVFKAKLTIGKCRDCNRPVTEDTVRGFDFDHVDESRKEDDVSDLVQKGVSTDRIQREMDECELRCANCHFKRTNRRREGRTFANDIIHNLIGIAATSHSQSVVTIS
jgi:hypothetical protein